MSPTPSLKCRNRYTCWLKIGIILKFLKFLDSCICNSSGLPRYKNVGDICCWLKINNFKNFKFVPIFNQSRCHLDFVSAVTLRSKNGPPHHSLLSKLCRYPNRSNLRWLKINNFKNFKFVPIFKNRCRPTFGFCIILRAKMSPTPSLNSSKLPRYKNRSNLLLIKNQ